MNNALCRAFAGILLAVWLPSSSTAALPEKAAQTTRQPEFERRAEHAERVLLAGAATANEPAIRKRPVLVTKVEPEYPQEAIRTGIESGRVLARLHIDEEGNVIEVNVIESTPEKVFDDAAVRALSQWKFQPAGESFVGEVEVKFVLGNAPQTPAPANSIEQQQGELGDLSRTIANLVKANEKELSSAPVLDAERVRLARDAIDASGTRETQINTAGEQLNEAFDAKNRPSNVSPELFKAIRLTAVASFRPDRLGALMERRLGETADAATLLVGLQWERSDVGRHLYRLDLESVEAVKTPAAAQFVRQLANRGFRTDDPRGRACAQADTLMNQTETLLPFGEALSAGTLIARAQQMGKIDLDEIRRAIVSLRPQLREVLRQSVLAQCLFKYQDLSDAEFEQWLAFLRSDSGGRYARALNEAYRDALLDASEVFTRTLVEVARQFKGRAAS